jgi:hypothetical protein
MTHLKPTGASLGGGCQGIWIVHATGALLTPVASANKERRRPPRFFVLSVVKDQKSFEPYEPHKKRFLIKCLQNYMTLQVEF